MTLVLQLLRYDKFKEAVINNMRVNVCSVTLRLPISTDEQVCLYNEFTLKATINHSGNLETGYYWAHIKDEDSSGWLKCIDTSVIATSFSGLSNTSLCLLVCSNFDFCKILQGGLTACLIFGYDVPTYNSSPARKSTVPA